MKLEDVACVRGWVRTELPDTPIQALDPSAPAPAKKIPVSPVASTIEAQPDAAERRWAEQAEPIEHLPTDLDDLWRSPRAMLAVPSLNTSEDEDEDEDEDETYDSEELQPGSEFRSDAATAGSAHAEPDIDPDTDAGNEPDGEQEEDDEDLLSVLFYDDPPAELCRWAADTDTLTLHAKHA